MSIIDPIRSTSRYKCIINLNRLTIVNNLKLWRKICDTNCRWTLLSYLLWKNVEIIWQVYLNVWACCYWILRSNHKLKFVSANVLCHRRCHLITTSISKNLADFIRCKSKIFWCSRINNCSWAIKCLNYEWTDRLSTLSIYKTWLNNKLYELWSIKILREPIKYLDCFCCGIIMYCCCAILC